MANGHPLAERYPLWMLWFEARVVQERINGLAATEAILIRAAIGAAVSKKGEEYFNELIETLRG